MSISRNLEKTAFYFPNRCAFIEAGNEIIYSEFNHRANMVTSGLLACGVKPGEHIALLAPNSVKGRDFSVK
jgi:acyl-CoA synthetase (AMP-forming)/AMP-acid ligase II